MLYFWDINDLQHAENLKKNRRFSEILSQKQIMHNDFFKVLRAGSKYEKIYLSAYSQITVLPCSK